MGKLKIIRAFVCGRLGREWCGVNLPAREMFRARQSKGKSFGAGRRVKMDRRGDRARNILIRWPATYNGGVNLRARLEIHHDESGAAVRRAAENGNGALIVPSNLAE